MAGINFNDLPKNLQSKLQPYFTVSGAKSVEEAIQIAKDAKVWTADDEKQLNALNGGANWGKTMDEFAFDSSKAAEYKQNLPKAEKDRQLAQARKRNNQEPSVWKTVGKYAGAVAAGAGAVVGGAALITGAAVTLPGWAVAGLIVGGGLLFTSCSEDNININTKQDVDIYIPKAPDYTDFLITIITKLQESGDVDAKNYAAILQSLANILQNQTINQSQIDSIGKRLKDLLQNIIDNQISMQIDNNKNAADLLAKLNQILNSSDAANVKLDKIMELLADIKGIGQSIDTKLDGILGKLAEALDNDQTIIASLKKLDANDQLTNQILNQILNAIGQLGSEYKGFFSTIINQVANNNAKMDDVNAMLKVINNNVTNLNALVKKYGDQGSVLGNAILNAIKNLDFSADVDLSGIEAMLNKLVTGQGETNANITNLTDVFNKFSANTTLQLNTIIDKLDKSAPDYNTKLDAIIKLLEKLDANNDARNNKILAAIEKLGANICTNLNAILAKLDKSAPDYNAKLDQIIKLLGQLDANNDARNNKILAAIDKLGVNVSADLTAILNKIGTGGGQGQDYSAILEKILNKLGDIQQDNNNNFSAVLKAIGNIDIKPADLSWIKEHLDAILEAIKDHDVVVTVEGGSCCCCHKDGSPVHEGVLGDLNDLLG